MNKLYTEKQLREVMSSARVMLPRYDNDIISSLKPIELPSDEEIEKAANTQSHYEGAMWLKYKILKTNR